MKLLYGLLFLTIVSSSFAFTQEQLEIADKVADSCVLESGVDPEDARKLRADDFSVNNDKLKCFANCFVTKIGFIKDGKVDEQAISEQLVTIFPKEKVDKILSECKNLTGANDCEKAYNAYKCYSEKKAEIIKELSEQQ